VNKYTGEMNSNSVSADLQLIGLMVLLQGDESEEVRVRVRVRFIPIG
jgi:hypothetical protein